LPVLIGTSGWQYADWRGRLYPHGLAQAKWLRHYADRFRTVEINNTFYQLPEVSTFEHWRDSTPDDFVLSVKASRYLTHVRRLRNPEDPVHRLLERATHLGDKLGPVLIQLPANFRVDLQALTEVLEAFPRSVRVAFEPRHESWLVDEVRATLRDNNAAFCLSDTPHRRTQHWRTADWGYLRLHEGRADPAPCYGRAALRTWACRLADLWSSRADVFVYFNNDRGGCAVRDAHRFALAVENAGLTATRVPDARESSLAREAPAGEKR
jgi:uncharacterized protein YecE (DUF72 family)